MRLPATWSSTDVGGSVIYGWLSRFKGPGQVNALENEAVDAATARTLNAIEFTDDYTRGRQGFYPAKNSSSAAVDLEE